MPLLGKCNPATNNDLQIMVCPCGGRLFSHKRDEIPPQATTQVKLEDTVLNERNHKVNDPTATKYLEQEMHNHQKWLIGIGGKGRTGGVANGCGLYLLSDEKFLESSSDSANLRIY